VVSLQVQAAASRDFILPNTGHLLDEVHVALLASCGCVGPIGAPVVPGCVVALPCWSWEVVVVFSSLSCDRANCPGSRAIPFPGTVSCWEPSITPTPYPPPPKNNLLGAEPRGVPSRAERAFVPPRTEACPHRHAYSSAPTGFDLITNHGNAYPSLARSDFLTPHVVRGYPRLSMVSLSWILPGLMKTRNSF